MSNNGSIFEPDEVKAIQRTVTAGELNVPESQICVICNSLIETMCFKNTGVCCELHRKERDHEEGRPLAIAGT